MLFYWIFICQGFAVGDVIPEKGDQIHIMNENARTLSEVALFYYGQSNFWKKIAKWNNLNPPYRLKLDQKLILKLAFLRSSVEGEKLLLEYWRKRFGLSRLNILPATKSDPKPVELIRKFNEAKIQFESKQVEIIYEPTSADQWFQKGKKIFDEKNYTDALLNFKESIKADPNFMAPWFYEIKVLHFLNRTSEEEEVKATFLSKHPHLKNLPFFSRAEIKEP